MSETHLLKRDCSNRRQTIRRDTIHNTRAQLYHHRSIEERDRMDLTGQEETTHGTGNPRL